MPTQPNVQTVYNSDVSLDPTIAGIAANKAKDSAILEKYRTDIVGTLGQLRLMLTSLNFVEPNQPRSYAIRGIVAMESIAKSLATIAASAPQTLTNTETILSIQMGE